MPPYGKAPTAHEEDAERAVRAALEIVQTVKGASSTEDLSVRIGIATGPVYPRSMAAHVACGDAFYQRGHANLPAEFNVAMSNHDARWLDMMRKNPRGAFDRCVIVDTATTGGRACSFVLWTEPPRAPR
jgi:hypothetical protein